MAYQSIESLPSGSVIAIVDDPCAAGPILRWAQAEASRLGCEAAVVFAPPFDDMAPPCSGAKLQHAVEQVKAFIDRVDGHAAGEQLITRPKSSLERLRAELLLAEPRLLVVGPAAGPRMAELLFASDGPGGPPVALVPAIPTKNAGPANSRRLLTVGFHESNTAINALRWAVTEAERTDAQVRVVVVWSEDQLGRLSGGVVISSHRCALPGQTAKRAGALALASSGVPLDRVSSLVVRGSPTAVLVREAASSDLLVVGAAPSRVHNHPVLGATAAACVARTPVPIVVVPGGGQPTAVRAPAWHLPFRNNRAESSAGMAPARRSIEPRREEANIAGGAAGGSLRPATRPGTDRPAEPLSAPRHSRRLKGRG